MSYADYDLPPTPAASIKQQSDTRRPLMLLGIVVVVLALISGAGMIYQAKVGALHSTQAQLRTSQAQTRDALAAQSSTQASLDAATSQIAACKMAVPDMKKIIVLEAQSITSLLKAIKAPLFVMPLYAHQATAQVQKAGRMADSTRTEADACESSSGQA